jgi:hypothetical protein
MLRLAASYGISRAKPLARYLSAISGAPQRGTADDGADGLEWDNTTFRRQALVLGFETIGNATLILYDGSPVLATDPWIDGDAYFSSWGPSHEIPVAQRDAIKSCRYLWFSHAHPDHCSVDSLSDLGSKEFLLADHRGARLQKDLTGMGFKVTVLPEREWVPISPNIKIMTLSDANQDSILLVDIDGVLIINLNDASGQWEYFVRSLAKGYKTAFLLRLWGEGVADMTNVLDEAGERIIRREDSNPPNKLPDTIQADVRRFRATHAIPFSSFHRFQREDSVWANGFITPQAAFHSSVNPDGPPILRPFVRYDRQKESITELNPRPLEGAVKSAAECGDYWSDRLEVDDKVDLVKYFQSKEKLRDWFRCLRFRVGGEETTVDINPKLPNAVGVTFEAPRQSLMAAVRYRVFDDMMIGNFMRVTLHGTVDRTYLNKTFTPVVGKYSDNGLADTRKELKTYMDHYYSKDRVGQVFMQLEKGTESLVRKFVKHDSIAHRSAKRLYWLMKR